MVFVKIKAAKPQVQVLQACEKAEAGSESLYLSCSPSAAETQALKRREMPEARGERLRWNYLGGGKRPCICSSKYAQRGRQ